MIGSQVGGRFAGYLHRKYDVVESELYGTALATVWIIPGEIFISFLVQLKLTLVSFQDFWYLVGQARNILRLLSSPAALQDLE